MRYALIGCGRIAARHIAAAQEAGLNIVALCDRFEAKAHPLDVDGAVIYADYEKMIAQQHPDLVAIATDSGSHAAIATACLNAGCHVIVEKPMALSLYDADVMIAAARRKNRVLAVCHQNRFNRVVLPTLRAVDGGYFGRLYHGAAQVRWHRPDDYYARDEWRGRWDTDGGCLMNQSIHCIDLLLRVFGKAYEVTGFVGRAAHPSIEAEDVGVAALRFESGALAIIEGSSCVYPENLSETLSIFGHKGTAVIGGKSLERVEHWQVDGFEAPQGEEVPNIYGLGHAPLYADVIEAIEQNRAPAVSGREGRAALELVLAIYRAFREKRVVRLPMGHYASEQMKGVW